MNGDRPVALLACTHPYRSALQVGSQHIARQLVRRGFVVHYFAAPVTPLHLFRWGSLDVGRRFLSAIRGGESNLGGRLTARVPFSLIAPAPFGFLGSSFVHESWWRTCILGVLNKELKQQVSLLYIDNLSYGFLLELFADCPSVFRVMDRHDRFPGAGPNARRIARRIAGIASLTVYSAGSLGDYVASLGARRSVVLPNGVDFELFNDPPNPAELPESIRRIAEPMVVYVGAIDDRVDMALVKGAAKALPAFRFLLVGPVQRRTRDPGLPGNVLLHPPVSHDTIPALLRKAVAGVIPFDVRDDARRVAGVRPLKLLEYLAAGIPAITAIWDETKDLEIPVWRYRTLTEFVGLVRAAATSHFDPEPGIAYARRSDWECVVDRMMDALPRNLRCEIIE